MSYLAFHGVFLLPPLLVLLAGARRSFAVLGPRAKVALPAVAAIALVYTTPWDNYLVWRGVWQYGADRVMGTIGYVPVEEYLFFLLQPLVVGLFLYRLLAASSSRAGSPAPSALFRWGPVVLWLVLAAVGAGLLLAEPEGGTYAGLILAWACPVAAGQWALGSRFIHARLRPFLLAVVLPTVYLWIADAIAIRLGIWDISNRYSFQLDPLGLPVEEAIFFLVTTLLCVQGLYLFLFLRPPARSTR